MAIITVVSSCTSIDDGNAIATPNPNNLDILALARISTDLSLFVAAVEQANLVDFFQSTSGITVFPPINAAFITYLDNNGFSSLEDIPNDTLAELLRNHVVRETITFENLETGYFTNESTSGPDGTNLSTFVNISNGIIINGTSRVILGDVNATNGILHLVNTVIELPDVFTFLNADPSFASLANAIDINNPTSNLTEQLAMAEPFTLFAPQSMAFQEALNSLGVTTINEIETSLLTDILTHHIVLGNSQLENLTNGDILNTLEGDAITITLPGTDINRADLTDGSGTSGIGLLTADIQATNGVLHSLDTVLIPNTTN